MYHNKKDLDLQDLMVQYFEYASKLMMFGVELFYAKVSSFFVNFFAIFFWDRMRSQMSVMLRNMRKKRKKVVISVNFAVEK